MFTTFKLLQRCSQAVIYTVIADPSLCCARQRMIVGCDGPVAVVHDVPQEDVVVSIESSRCSVVGLDGPEDE